MTKINKQKKGRGRYRDRNENKNIHVKGPRTKDSTRKEVKKKRNEKKSGTSAAF